MRACLSLCNRVYVRPTIPCAARRQYVQKTIAVPRPPHIAPDVPAFTRKFQSRKMVITEAISPVHLAIGVVGVAALLAWVDALLKSRKPELVYQGTAFNKAVLSRCPTLQSVYQCTPFLTNGHVETILVAKLRKPPGVDYRREIILTKDGGAVAIDWEHVDDNGKELPEDAPVLILFPGLTGGSGDSYVQHAVLQARHAGIRAAVFNSRGTADSPVITPQFYSASFTDDTREVVAHVRKRFPDSTLFAAGWSLGANILVNYLGEQGSDTPLEAAVSMCNPFDLTISNKQINEGFNKIYNWNLAASLKRIFTKHQLIWRGHPGPAKPHLVPSCNTIREFDEAITVHSFDWQDVDAYYAGSSSAKRIPAVKIPLLCIQALDDPIAPAEAIPCDAIEDNSNCLLAVTPCGGHLGWAAGPGAPFNHPWTDGAVVEWLTSVHTELMKHKSSNGGGSKGSSSAGDGKQQQEAVQNTAGKEQQPQRTVVSVTAMSCSSSSTVMSAVDGGDSCSSSSGSHQCTQPGGEVQSTQQQQQQQRLEPAVALEQMWWGEANLQQQQQQQGASLEQQHGSHSSSSSGSTTPEPVTGLDLIIDTCSQAAVHVGCMSVGGSSDAVKAASEDTTSKYEQQAEGHVQQPGVCSVQAAVEPDQRHSKKVEQVEVAEAYAASDVFTTQLRWAM